MIFRREDIEKVETKDEGDKISYNITTSKGNVTRLKELGIDVKIEQGTEELEYIIPSWCKDVKDGDHFDEKDIDVAKVVETILNREHESDTMMVVSAYVCTEKVYNELKKLNHDERDLLPDGLMMKIYATGTSEDWDRVKEAKIRGISEEL